MGSRTLGVAALWVVLLVALEAFAHRGGRAGHSGREMKTCNACHFGGQDPVVKLEGPSSLDAGAQATIVFRLQTDAAVTGMNAAPSDGVVAGDSDGGITKSFFDEVVHADAAAPGDGGEVVYRFSFTAPAFGGPVTLYAAGNACNNDDQPQGDRAAATTLQIAINGPPRPVVEAGSPPPPPPPVDSGADSSTDAGAPPSVEEDDSGCFAAGRGGADASAVGAATVLAIAFTLRASRRRTRKRNRKKRN